MGNTIRIMCAALAITGAWPAPAQLVIDREAPFPYPIPPKTPEKEVEEDEKERGPVIYSGEEIAIASTCEPETLSRAGMICNAASPCEIELELTAAREAGEAVVVAGDLYSSSATVEAIILRTEDGGSTWVEAVDRMGGTALDEMQFVDGEHGWIVGRETIGGGQRPFLLASDDGGASWARREIEDDEDYRGAVLELRFDSPEHGMVIVERPAGLGDPFEMRESFNGGRSWSLRQLTSERPALPGSRRRVVAPTVQVREEDGGELYVVERRSGESWEALGRFVAAAGVCGGRE